MPKPMPCVNLLLASDLHLDVAYYDLRAPIHRVLEAGARIDGVVLAGDILEVAGGSPVDYALDQVPPGIPVFFVPGNHDFYGGRYGKVLAGWQDQARGTGVAVLVEQSCEVSEPSGGKIVLLGTPLWSNLQGAGPVSEAFLRASVARRVADFSCMAASDGSPWNPADMLSLFDASYRFLLRELSPAALEDGLRRVVVTHFAPHRDSVEPRWRSDVVSGYFCNHLPELVEQADLWLHGHTHGRFDYRVGRDRSRGRVVCHARGNASGADRARALSYEPRLLSIPVKRVRWPAG